MEDLNKDENGEEADVGDLLNDVSTISSEEIEAVIKDLPKRKTCGNETFLQSYCKACGRKVKR